MREDLIKILQRWDFAILALIVVVINIPYLPDAYVPTHDTMYGFQLFYFFYNNFYFYGEIAQWMPYDSFGLISNHEQLAFLTPFNYLLGFIGAMLRLDNVLLLFKLSIVFQQLVFLSGMYLLSRSVFSNRATTFTVCLASFSCGADLYYQLYYFFSIFYMFPMAAYFLLMFFKRQQPEYLWLTGITVMFWETGEVIYHICLWFFILTVMSGVLWSRQRDILKCLFKRSWANLVLFAVFLSLVLSFYVLLKDFVAGVDLRSRDAGGHNSLGMFLTWAGIYDLGSFVRWEIMQRPAGFLTLIFSVFALVKVRGHIFMTFAAAAGVILWLSFAGIFAILVYYFPLMNYYRHIGYTYHFLHILLLIVAGFGLDHFWQLDGRQKMKTLLIFLAGLIFVFDAFRIPGAWLTELYTKDIVSGRSLIEWIKHIPRDLNTARVVINGGGILLIALLCSRIDRRNWSIAALIIFIALADLGIFQYLSWREFKPAAEVYRTSPGVFKVHQAVFPEQRTPEPVEARAQKGMALLMRPEASTKYTAAHSFLQFDACYSTFDGHVLPLGFSRLLKTRTALDADLMMTLGCRSPKLRLMTGALFTDTLDEAMAKMRAMPKIHDQLILRGVEESVKASLDREPAGVLPGEIAVKDFSANQLKVNVNVRNPGGAWLVYADAANPGWRAAVNGKKAPVSEAYLAFKAVRLSSGKNDVRFYFYNPATAAAGYFIAIFSIAASLAFLILFIRVLWAGALLKVEP